MSTDNACKEWISVKDRKPECTGLCFVYDNDYTRFSFLAGYNKKYDCFVLLEPAERQKASLWVTHWASLPLIIPPHFLTQ